jgi:hypothetical protein
MFINPSTIGIITELFYRAIFSVCFWRFNFILWTKLGNFLSYEIYSKENCSEVRNIELVFDKYVSALPLHVRVNVVSLVVKHGDGGSAAVHALAYLRSFSRNG